MFKHNSLWCCIETYSSELWTIWTSYSSVRTSASGREVYAMDTEMGELITKPEQIILVTWALPLKIRSTISGCKLSYRCGFVKLTMEVVIVLGFLSCALRAVVLWDSQQCQCGRHEPRQVGCCARCSERQNLSSDISSLNSQDQDIYMECLSVLMWV